MSGAPNPIYVRARRVLLDAVEALGAHRAKVVLVGAQAVYQHTGEGDLVVTQFTQDGDLALDPRQLEDSPLIEECMLGAGFVQPANGQPGQWLSVDGVEVDLMVPARLAGNGKRAARIPPHGRSAARRAEGLEAVLVDSSEVELRSLEPERDPRGVLLRIAGPAALLVSKAIKLRDRNAQGVGRLRDKDALDMYRLLFAVPENIFLEGYGRLFADELSAEVTREALSVLSSEFTNDSGEGIQMLRRALGADPEVEEGVSRAILLTRQLLSRLEDKA